MACSVQEATTNPSKQGIRIRPRALIHIIVQVASQNGALLSYPRVEVCPLASV